LSAPTNRTRAIALAVSLAAVVAGCEGVAINLPFDDEASDSERRAYELRFKRPKGGSDRYQATYKVRVRADPKRMGYLVQHSAGLEIDEDVTSDLILYYTGKTDDGVFDRVVFRRRDETRKRLEVSPNGRVKHETKLLNMQPKFTPNFAAEPSIPKSDIVFVPMNELGMIAKSKLYPYHYAWDDSLCYVFPVFPKAAVGVGDKWRVKMPVIVGTEFKKNITPLNVTFTLKDLRRVRMPDGKEGPVCALIEYTYYALLDTGTEKKSSLPPLADNQAGLLRRRDVVEGEGLAYFDIAAGKTRWRREEYRVEVERHTRQPVRDESGKKKKPKPGSMRARRMETVIYRSRITVDFGARLLVPGERASDRPSRIDP
jgi:hypothetical protein